MSLFHRTEGLIRCLVMYSGRGDARNGPALLSARLGSGEQETVEDEILTLRVIFAESLVGGI